MKSQPFKTIITNLDKLRIMKKEESDHIAKVVAMGCCICAKLGLGETPAVPHHIGNQSMGMKATNFEVIPLCPYHHNQGPIGEAVHSGRKSFEKKFGTEQELLKQTLEWLSL